MPPPETIAEPRLHGYRGMRRITAIFLLFLVTAGPAEAQGLRQAVADAARIHAPLLQASSPALQNSTSRPVRRRSIGRRIAGTALGAFGGFFACAYLGAAIDGDCGGCDDPGFKGFLIGAPIGTVAGGIIGYRFF